MIYCANNLDVLRTMPENSIDAIVTDPPYGLKFMGKKWDYDVPSVDFWKEALRVLKPGGHVLSFGGTRTYHRMVVAIEDAAFEIRDQLQWIYGSGFPKSHNLKDEWQGWGTALKPANEPIVLARKPLEKGLTVAENVVKWGTGALNIEGSRIGTEVRKNTQVDSTAWHGNSFGANPQKFNGVVTEVTGRWPANVLFDADAAQMLDEQSGPCKVGALTGQPRTENKIYSSAGKTKGRPRFYTPDEPTGASRFFYVAKASKSERNAGLDSSNVHNTVKPLKLMQYLIKLVTPPNGTVLDPFMGSGSTGVAAKQLGFEFIGIELNPEYVEIAKKRIGE